MKRKSLRLLMLLLIVSALLVTACGKPEITPDNTVTDAPTASPEATKEPTATLTPSPTVTPKPTATATPVPTATATPEPTATATPEPTATATPEPTATPTPEPTATPTPAPVNIESAASAVNNMKIGWNLGNSLDSWGDWINSDIPSDTEKAWGNVVTTKEFITKVKSLGFNAVRVPVTWRNHFDADGNIDEAWMNRVEEVVNYVLDNDMYCIINIHHDTGEQGWLKASGANYDKNNLLFKKLWTQIAERFKNYDGHLLFEGFNEMLDENNDWSNPGAGSLTAINNYNQAFVSAVRATGGNNATRNLICNTYAASTNSNILSAFRLPSDSANSHLIVEAHNYAPMGFTFTDTPWTTQTDYLTANQMKEIEGFFNNINTYFVKKNIPFILGEYGSTDKHNNAERAKYSALVVSTGKKYGITCFLWDNGGDSDMGVLNRNGGTDPAAEIITEIMKAIK